jgi:hypothetical protein
MAALRSRVPETNDTFLIRSDNRIGVHGKNGVGECIRKTHDWRNSKEHFATKMMLKCRTG